MDSQELIKELNIGYAEGVGFEIEGDFDVNSTNTYVLTITDELLSTDGEEE